MNTGRDISTEEYAANQQRDARSTRELGSTSFCLVPITLAKAKEFVREFHRHNPNSKATWKFGVGLENNGRLIGVAMAGLPAARLSMTRYVLEVNRTCTDGTVNANSLLYGAIARAAKALGYKKLITYTLPIESGSSLRGAGWAIENANAGSLKSWKDARGTGQGDIVNGVSVRVPGRKIRWKKDL